MRPCDAQLSPRPHDPLRGLPVVAAAGGREDLLRVLWQDAARVLGKRIEREGAHRARNVLAMQEAFQEAIERKLMPHVAHDLKAARTPEDENAVRDRYDAAADTLMNELMYGEMR